MDFNAIALFSVMLMAAILIEPLAERCRLPFSSVLVLIGFLGSELITVLDFDTGLRWQQFSHLILYVLVPILVFESAFNMNAKSLVKNLASILLLAVPLMLLAALMTGALLYFGIGHPQGFPWQAALLTGVLLSATDPVAVVSLFKRLGAPESLSTLLEGESLFNDATAVVLYMLLISTLLMPNNAPSAGDAALTFLYTFLGGISIGLACGIAFCPLYKIFSNRTARASLSVVAAIMTFYIAEHLLHISGIVALLAAGLLLGEFHRRNHGDYFVNHVWEFGAYTTNAVVFILSGMTITWFMFSSQWLAMLIGIGSVLLVRLIIVYGFLAAFSSIPGIPKIPPGGLHVMHWGGLRGAVTLALALSLPTEIEPWFTIQSIAYGVVLFTLLVQAPTIGPLIRRTKEHS